ncbi:MAG: signal peptide peptidase SppA [Planctomycetota bacterium]|nr:signal peptide peptidase SppA [Planctomycetota bacterium]
MTDTPQPPAPPPAAGNGAGQPQVQPFSRGPLAPPPAPKPARRVSALTVIALVLLGLSLAANAVLVIALVAMAGFSGIDGFGYTEDAYVERVIEKGSSSNKIVVIRVEGIIEESMAEALRLQLQRAAHDRSVKAVILRINSPGGGLTASDMIYHDVKTILEEKPVIAAMDSVAASGGYYVACAADKIVAQHTTITGSIGVIGEFFFLNGLLKDKLGVQVVTLKMGDQKDWPNMFAADMPPEQRDYLMDTLLRPGYDRFVDTVSEAREIKRDEVLKLATGRVFMAPEARKNKLIDEIGYFDQAIKIAEQEAGISGARVVEYIQPFRLLDILGASAKTSTLLNFSREKLSNLASPRIMYLWTGY